MKKRMLSFLLCFVLAFSSLTALAEPVDSSVNADKSEVLKEAANGEDAVAGFVTGSGVLKDGSEYGYGYSPFLTEDCSEEEIVSGIKSSLEQSSEDKLLSSSNSQTANSHDAAVNLIKSYMVSRTTAFNIYLDYDISNIYTECNNLQDEAMDEKIATNTKEGDYLRQNTLKWGWNSTGNSVNFNYTYTASAAQETEVDAKVNELLSSLGLMDSTKSTVDKIKAIHDYLCDTITYYNDGSNRCHSTYGALISKSCVCQGYGSAFQRLCKEAGIGVRSITGTGNGESHAWNIVRLDDGYWYNLDATWDDQITTIIRDYYLKSNADFGAHVRANRYNTAEFNAQYPMTSISYVEEADIETLNIDNPEFKFTALDDSEISSTVDGRAKLLIFFSTTCWKSQQTIASLEECDWLDKVDVYCLEVNHQDAVTVETFANTYAPKAYENENIILLMMKPIGQTIIRLQLPIQNIKNWLDLMKIHFHL